MLFSQIVQNSIQKKQKRRVEYRRRKHNDESFRFRGVRRSTRDTRGDIPQIINQSLLSFPLLIPRSFSRPSILELTRHSTHNLTHAPNQIVEQFKNITETWSRVSVHSRKYHPKSVWRSVFDAVDQFLARDTDSRL